MFRADNMAYAVQYIEKMFGGGETVEKMLAYDYYYDNLELIVLLYQFYAQCQYLIKCYL